ncbi:prepilin-type cleavage/methylation domain-containing protein [Pararhodospirillum oryzae]|uniref:Prepilin-type N-terminal cleavage/methylation domain-containing protein n=1 Tax=Pararhodospirillum oryzae TaxID=478448 RepID=A0A512H9K9_9PROT|nr:prepilin-type cleavage/methylation domain-containing protein [Pararhodospirillum oryzae]GEO82122.1 prepilin-type N-terminal cleavage/methylation domain-containing protein [Pararhodospirillum oryzae]
MSAPPGTPFVAPPGPPFAAPPGTSFFARPGATLTEIAVLLIGLGLLAQAGLSLSHAGRQGLAEQRTALAARRLEAALATAALATATLPCPDARDAPDGRADSTWCQRVGLVPWRTLGIARADALDGWGALFSYRPAPELVAPAHGGTAWVPGAGPLACDRAGATLRQIVSSLMIAPGPAPLPHAQAAYALISHGPNRKGAVLADGQPFALGVATATRAEALNAGVVPAGGAAQVWHGPDPSDAPAPDGTLFDDRVFWVPPLVLLEEAGCRPDGPGF